MQSHWPDLKGKTVLCIGTAASSSLRDLAAQLIRAGGGTLIINEIQSESFERLEQELSDPLLNLCFLRSSAVNLAGLAASSVDFIVCERTLSAVDAIQGQAVLALSRFYQVLKPGGSIALCEDLPVYMAANPAQNLWAQQSALLRAAGVLAGHKLKAEFQPDVLSGILEALGYEEPRYEDYVCSVTAAEWQPHFMQKLQILLLDQPAEIQSTFLKVAEDLLARASQDSLEVPYFEMVAKKVWRVLE